MKYFLIALHGKVFYTNIPKKSRSSSISGVHIIELLLVSTGFFQQSLSEIKDKRRLYLTYECNCMTLVTILVEIRQNRFSYFCYEFNNFLNLKVCCSITRVWFINLLYHKH